MTRSLSAAKSLAPLHEPGTEVTRGPCLFPMDGSALSKAIAIALSLVASDNEDHGLSRPSEGLNGTSLAILNLLPGCRSLGLLLDARLRGFRGPVLLASRESIGDLWRFGLLRYAGVHETTGFPISLMGIAAKMSELRPLSVGNLHLLQSEIRAGKSRVSEKARAILAVAGSERERAISGLEELYKALWNDTCSIWHLPVWVEGLGVNQGQYHFRMLVDCLRDADEDSEMDRIAEKIAGLFEWCAEKCMEAGVVTGECDG